MSLVFNQSALAKGWKRYYIMHKNRRVASIREDGTCTLYYKSFLPFNLWLEQGTDFETRINNLNNFYYWCASRVLTLDRQYAKEIMNTIGAFVGATAFLLYTAIKKLINKRRNNKWKHIRKS